MWFKLIVFLVFSIFTLKSLFGKICVDLDVHQGNGHERSKLHFQDLDNFIIDVYNGGIFPLDFAAKAAINVNVELRSGTGDEEYLEAIQQAIQQGFQECDPIPDLIIYNAGILITGCQSIK